MIVYYFSIETRIPCRVLPRNRNVWAVSRGFPTIVSDTSTCFCFSDRLVFIVTVLAGDASHQQNDAEVQAWNTYFRLFKNDKCLGSPTYEHAFTGRLTDDVNHVTLFVSNEFVRIITDQGMDEQVCHKCLFALSGQPDVQTGGANEDMYISFNRVIQWFSWRVGYGVCTATIRWVCADTFIF